MSKRMRVELVRTAQDVLVERHHLEEMKDGGASRPIASHGQKNGPKRANGGPSQLSPSLDSGMSSSLQNATTARKAPTHPIATAAPAMASPLLGVLRRWVYAITRPPRGRPGRMRKRRLIGSIHRECLDHILVFGEAHLCRILAAYISYYNELRTHLSVR